MASASRDGNNRPTLIGALSTDGATITLVQANASTQALKVADASTGSDHGPAAALRDGNFVPVLMGVSETDGTTPVVIYADASGNLLVDSN